LQAVQQLTSKHANPSVLSYFQICPSDALQMPFRCPSDAQVLCTSIDLLLPQSPLLQIMPSSMFGSLQETQLLQRDAAIAVLVKAEAEGPDMQLLRSRSGATLLAPKHQQCVPDLNTSSGAQPIFSISSPQIGGLFLPHHVRWEASCDDGIDNDCDGLTDGEDPDCGFKPVMKTPKLLSWSPAAPLPNAAAAALVALAYAKADGGSLKPEDRTRLQCWALGQAKYMVGGGSGRSYVVGQGRQAPQRVAHMSSACPASGPCSWYESYYSASPNPQAGLVEGALVGGPDARDGYSDERASAGAAVGVHYNAPFVGALAGLLDSGVSAMACMKLYTVYGA
jgi:hypothetical protein